MRALELLARMRLPELAEKGLRVGGINLNGAWRWYYREHGTNVSCTGPFRKLLVQGLVHATYHTGGTASVSVTDKGDAMQFTPYELASWNIQGDDAVTLLAQNPAKD